MGQVMLLMVFTVPFLILPVLGLLPCLIPPVRLDRSPYQAKIR